MTTRLEKEHQTSAPIAVQPEVCIESHDHTTSFKLNGIVIPEPGNTGKTHDQGWRLTVIDRADLSNIVFNCYFGYDDTDFQKSGNAMYEEICKAVKNQKLDKPKYLWMLGTYGRMMAMTSPSHEFCQVMQCAGAGQMLTFLENLKYFRSSVDVNIRYTLIGIPGSGTNKGIEQYTDNNRGRIQKTPPIICWVPLYKNTVDGGYWLENVANTEPKAGPFIEHNNPVRQEAATHDLHQNFSLVNSL
jgi:hypothetical protein